MNGMDWLQEMRNDSRRYDGSNRNSLLCLILRVKLDVEALQQVLLIESIRRSRPLTIVSTVGLETWKCRNTNARTVAQGVPGETSLQQGDTSLGLLLYTSSSTSTRTAA